MGNRHNRQAGNSNLEITNKSEIEMAETLFPQLLLAASNLSRISDVVLRISALSVITLALGCGSAQPAPQDKANLQAASRSIEAQQFDQAIAQADSYLAKIPHGPGSAEALYLKGRGYEGRVAQNTAAANANLQSARTAYISALAANPSPVLEPSIHASLANVAYFQDDYATALAQWTTAYPKLLDDSVRGWVLYRIGICHQRLGHFEQADQTFAQVQNTFRNSVPAQRAREHQGARAFHVQLATFASATSADNAAVKLRTQGVTPVRTMSPQGQQQLRIGPVATYAQAMTLKNRFSSQYPDAMVVP
jgi:TolA-binding protein